jgi:hypothetical protein
MKEPKKRKRYTANTPVVRAVSELIDQYGGRLVLEAVGDYCFQNLGLRCFAAGFGQAAEQLGSRICWTSFQGPTSSTAVVVWLVRRPPNITLTFPVTPFWGAASSFYA